MKKKSVKKSSSRKKPILKGSRKKSTLKKKWTSKDTNRIIQNIKSLKIQGATNVAKKALEILHNEYLLNNSEENIYKTILRLHKTRPTEPMMRNTLKYYIYLVKNSKTPKEAYEIVNNYFDYAKRKIAFFGSDLIETGKTYYTHCHSSDVMVIFKKARENHLFRVFNTETRPRFQGRITAIELSKLGIPVVHFVDSAARLALKQANTMLIGCDAITELGEVYNKIGSEMIAEIAKKRKVKVYVCGNSWKLDPLTFFGFDEEIEKRHEKEVWNDAPQGVIVNNYAFEKVHPKNITGIISEFGILTPKQFVNAAQKKNKWMFK